MSALAEEAAVSRPSCHPRTRERIDPPGWWAGPEAARTPARFRDRVIAQFRAPTNISYLRRLFGERVPAGAQRRHALATLHSAVIAFSSGEGRALDLLQSDPVAQRGALRPASDLWAEVRRLNRAFFEDRLAFLRDGAHLIDGRAPRDGVADDDEPYHMRMFISDSLRPPGLEHLNTPGPLYALREDQSTWLPRRGRPEKCPARREGFVVRPGADTPDAAFAPDEDDLADDSSFILYSTDDAPWSRGRANRTPEQAMAEYWGDDRAATDTTTGAPEKAGVAYGDAYSWGDKWLENGGTRYMRYPSIPFWQKGGREGYDYDIEETLGTAGREMDAHVRRWDMSKLRQPRGQEYRRYGSRSGHVV